MVVLVTASGAPRAPLPASRTAPRPRRRHATWTWAFSKCFQCSLSSTSCFQDGNPPKAAVRNLDLGIRRGEVFGLLGPNGAGKTSAIHMMIGFLEPTAGAGVQGLGRP